MLIAAEMTLLVIAEGFFLLLQHIPMLMSSFCSSALFHDFPNMLHTNVLN